LASRSAGCAAGAEADWIGAAELRHRHEIHRHDADDFAASLSSNTVLPTTRVGAKAAPPHAVAQHDDAGSAGLILAGRDRARPRHGA
jgi:hypothetical protein